MRPGFSLESSMTSASEMNGNERTNESRKVTTNNPPPPITATSLCNHSGNLSGFIGGLVSGAEEKIGDTLGESAGIQVRSIAKHDDGQVLVSEPLDIGAKADGFAVMPHADVAVEGIQEPAEAVRGGLSVRSSRAVAGNRDRREGGLHFRRTNQRVIPEGIVPFRQIGKRTINSAVTEGGRRGTLVGLLPVATAFRIAKRAIGDVVLPFFEGERVLHLKRRKDSVAKEIAERLARNFRDHEAENHVAGVAVVPFRTRRELGGGGLLLEELQDLGVLNLMSVGPQPRISWGLGGDHQVLVVRETRGVIQQVANGDGFSVVGKSRKNFRQASDVSERTVVHEKHDGHGGELLGAGGQAEIRDGVDFGPGVEVVDAVAALEDYAIISPYKNGDTGRGGRSYRGKYGIDFLCGRETRGRSEPRCGAETNRRRHQGASTNAAALRLAQGKQAAALQSGLRPPKTSPNELRNDAIASA